MDLEDDIPRLAPPPKPTLLQLNMPRPEVPEISLMFDSDDSLIWQNTKSQKTKNITVLPSIQQQCDNSSQKGRLSSERIRPASPLVDESGKEDSPRTSMQQVPRVLHKTPVQRFISSNNLARNDYKKLESHQQPQRLSSQVSSEKKDSPDSEKRYDPLLYSPSQRKKDSVYPAARTSSLKYTSSQADRDTNVMQQGQFSSTKSAPGDIKTDRELEVNKISPDVMKQSQSLSSVKKVVHFDASSSSPSEELTVRPKTMVSDQEKFTATPPNQRNYFKDGPPFSDDRIRYDTKRTNEHNSGRYVNTHYSEAPVPSNVYSVTPLASYNQGGHNHFTTHDVLPVQQPSVLQPRLPPYTSPYSGQSPTIDNIQRPTDPKIYQLLEDQNQHILKLYETLETFLQKKEPHESVVNRERETNKRDLQFKDSPPCRCRCKHVATQTIPSEERQMRSVGTNTDFSWEEVLFMAKNDNENFEKNANGRLPVSHRSSKRGEVQRLLHKNDSKHVFRKKNTNGLEQKHSSEVKEISFSMREIVMTVQEDQPSPEPSLHIDMEEYVEDSDHEVSAAEGPSEPDDYGKSRKSPELRNSKRRENYNHNHQENGPLAPSEENRPSTTFYNNVMTNIQQILQSSKTAEEEEVEEKQDRHEVRQQQAVPNADERLLDPQIEAVRQQLLQFGISFIDPSSLANNHRPMLDTVYMPGIHNMLSMYQSNIMAPYQNVYRESDATAAKYLTDTQLAAIASKSPVMREQNRKITDLQEVNSSRGLHPDVQHTDRNNLQLEGYSTYDNNLSMATKKFLVKYGLRDNK